MGAVFLSNNYEGKRTKYLDIKYHFVREYTENQTVTVKFVKSAENYADIFTKHVSAPVLNNLTDYLLAARCFSARWGVVVENPKGVQAFCLKD